MTEVARRKIFEKHSKRYQNLVSWVEVEVQILYEYILLIVRLSFECRKTKTKVITLTNHNSRKQSNEPIRARNKYMSPVPSAGKTRASKSRLVLDLLLIGRGSGARFFNQSQSVAMQN